YVFAALVFIMIPILLTTSTSELAPPEDQGYILVFQNHAPNATLQQRLFYSHQVYEDFTHYPEMDSVFQIEMPGNAPGTSMSGMVFKPWDQRKRSVADMQRALSGDLAHITGFNAAVVNPPPLPGSQGLPVQFVIKSTKPFDQLAEVSWDFLAKAMQ